MELLVALALATTTIAVPARANANVSIAADDAFVAIAWSASTPAGPTDIFAAVSTDGGRTFGAPVRVNDAVGDARANGEQPPRLALSPRAGHAPHITVVWTAKGAAGTKLLQARSEDGGRSFAKAITVPDTDAPGSRGWQAAAGNPTGGVDVVWLDHRELVPSEAQMSHLHHQPSAEKPDGVAMAQKSKLYFAALDGSVPPRALTGGVCYCCKTALASGPNGARYIAWRHVYPGNIRDIAFVVSQDGGRTFAPPVRISEDKWVLEGCPDDGPAMVVDRQNRIHVVWPTLVQDGPDGEPNLALFYAMSLDGRTFTRRERIPTQGTPHHLQLALDGAGRLIVTWDELERGKRRVAFARARSAEGRGTEFTREIISGSEPAIYPMAAATAGDQAVVAWTSGGPGDSVIRVTRRAVAWVTEW